MLVLTSESSLKNHGSEERGLRCYSILGESCFKFKIEQSSLLMYELLWELEN